MVVAVAAARVVQMTVHQVVSMVPMGNCLMTATKTMDVLGSMRSASVGRGAMRRVRLTYRQRMLIDVSVVGMVQVPIMEIVGMLLVLDRRVSAAWSVGVLVTLVDRMLAHVLPSSFNSLQ
ncbi:MAG: hypothetical protein RMJ98_17450 [Myxococcales bacterium]|nr:hypothetical protein [Polyangiaceae bacterium]MDW8251082.1 hypothetical protein [Myxococcales bacterium]